MVNKDNSEQSRFHKILGYINNKFSAIKSREIIYLLILFLLAICFKYIFFKIQVPIVRNDAFRYVAKALELTKGQFAPLTERHIGWPYFLALFFAVIRLDTIFEYMQLTRIISLALGILSFVPFVLITKKVLNKKHQIVAIVLFIFSYQMVVAEIMAHTEPFYIFLLLWCFYFIQKSFEDYRYLIIASAISGLIYITRINGLIVFIITLISGYLIRKKAKNFHYKYIAYATIIFLLLVTPMFYHRYVNFGSPFAYGSLANYFVDEPWLHTVCNIPAPSLIEYLRTHTIQDYAYKFIQHGALNILFIFSFFSVTVVLLPFFIMGLWHKRSDPRYIPFYVTFVIWLSSHIPSWHVFDEPRYFYPLVPLIFIFSTIGLFKFKAKMSKYGKHLIIIVVITYLISSIGVLLYYYVPDLDKKTGLNNGIELGRWIAENIEGNITTYGASDFIMMHFNDVNTLTTYPKSYKSDEKNIIIIAACGHFTEPAPALAWYKSQGVTHIVLDVDTEINRPHIRQMIEAYPERFEKLYSNLDQDPVFRAEIYKIR